MYLYVYMYIIPAAVWFDSMFYVLYDFPVLLLFPRLMSLVPRIECIKCLHHSSSLAQNNLVLAALRRRQSMRGRISTVLPESRPVVVVAVVLILGTHGVHFSFSTPFLLLRRCRFFHLMMMMMMMMRVFLLLLLVLVRERLLILVAIVADSLAFRYYDFFLFVIQQR